MGLELSQAEMRELLRNLLNDRFWERHCAATTEVERRLWAVCSLSKCQLTIFASSAP